VIAHQTPSLFRCQVAFVAKLRSILCEFRKSPQAELRHGLDSAQGGYITPV
jgi:hypothetical protein